MRSSTVSYCESISIFLYRRVCNCNLPPHGRKYRAAIIVKEEALMSNQLIFLSFSMPPRAVQKKKNRNNSCGQASVKGKGVFFAFE